MHTDGLNKRLVRFLENYYTANFGGPENWAQLESVRFDGRLHLDGESMRFLAYKKKPDLTKIILYLEGGELIMAYDGSDAWQMDTRLPDARPADMPPDEALNFIRDATTGGHLLYPQTPGKSINFGGTRLIGEDSCLDVSVTLPNGQTVEYAINLANSAEKQQITLNARSGLREVTTHHAYRTLHGVRFPVDSTLEIGGEVIHRLEITEITLNTGAATWMFKRPSAAFAPEAKGQGTSSVPPAESPSLDSVGPKSFFDISVDPLPALLEIGPAHAH